MIVVDNFMYLRLCAMIYIALVMDNIKKPISYLTKVHLEAMS